MSVHSDINDVLVGALGASVDGVYDTKLPDGYVLTKPVVIVSSVSDVADLAIDGPIVRREGRWQVSVRAADLISLRSVKQTVITALHGYSGGSIVRSDLESCPGELFETDVTPFEYHAPIDFMIQF